MDASIKQAYDMLLMEEARRLVDIENARDSFWAYRRLINPGLKDGWFRRELENALMQWWVDYCAGLRPVLVLSTPPQFGKLLADETPILTTQGWKAHGDLVPGNEVFSVSGKPVKVLAVSEKGSANLRVTLSNGEKIYCHERHEWTVYDRRRKCYRTVETGEMMQRGLYWGEIGKRGSRYLYKLPLKKAIEGFEKTLPADPYMLGVWLGDGSQTKPSITFDKKDIAVIEELERRGFNRTATFTHKKTGVLTASFAKGKMALQLKAAGVFVTKYGIRKKHIPEAYLTASIRQRLELLAGLIDTDGYVYHVNGRVVFTTSDKRLADTFVELISTFGWSFSMITVQPRKSSSGINGVKPYYVIGFNPDRAIPCVLDRKRNTPDVLRKMVSIVSIEQVTEGRIGHCITVDAEDGLYLAGRTMQPTHNSITVADFVSWMAGKAPHLRTIFSSFSERLGVRTNLKLQRVYDSQIYHDVFPDTKINSSNVVTISGQYLRNREILEYVGKGGYFRNTTVGGPVTGESLDVGIIDDPVKGREEANSLTMREKVWEWFTDDFGTRFSEHAGMILIMTRWHIDDLAGRIIENDPRAKVLVFKAIADEDEEFRGAGEPLFPELKSLDFLLAKKAVMRSASWQSLYQGSPIIDDGDLVKVEKIQIVKNVPGKIIGSVRYWDKAGTDGGGAHTAGVLMHKLQDGRYCIADVVRGQWSAGRREDTIKHTAQTDGFSVKVWVEQEPGSGGKESAENTVKNLAGYPIYVERVTGSKETRAEPFAAQVEAGNVCILDAPWTKEFIDEGRLFPNGKYKDQIDAASGGFNKLALLPSGLNISNDILSQI